MIDDLGMKIDVTEKEKENSGDSNNEAVKSPLADVLPKEFLSRESQRIEENKSRPQTVLETLGK